MAKFTPIFCKIVAKALVIFCARWSKLPAQPTKNKMSGLLPSVVNSAIVGICMVPDLRAKIQQTILIG
jgi:hypothetical protein